MKYTFGFLWKEGLTINGNKQGILFVLFSIWIAFLIVGNSLDLILLSIIFVLFGYSIAVTNNFQKLYQDELERNNSSTS